jgi:hypothetical protein
VLLRLSRPVLPPPSFAGRRRLRDIASFSQQHRSKPAARFLTHRQNFAPEHDPEKWVPAKKPSRRVIQ